MGAVELGNKQYYLLINNGPYGMANFESSNKGGVA